MFLYLAVSLLFIVGLAHSLLGERYILIRLFRRSDLPHLFGSDDFTKRTLRFAWHLTTVAWWGFAAMLVLIARDSLTANNALTVIGTTFIIHALISLFASKAKHFSWWVFLSIAACVFVTLYSV